MADRYIDVFEISEYGNFFLNETGRLVGASPLVDVAALQARVRAAKELVEQERSAAGLTGGGLRQERAGTDQAVAALRATLTRFHSYLHSLDPAEVSFDLEGFFPEGNLGTLSQLKPSDLEARVGKVLEGFALPKNQDFPQRDSWKTRLGQGRDALAQALTGRGEQRNEGSLVSSKLGAAREAFLVVYNGVAKPLVRGLLNDLGRGEELPLYQIFRAVLHP
jgi:hypothetical protein